MKKSKHIIFVFDNNYKQFVEIKCQLGATQVFTADLIACSTCFGHQYVYHRQQPLYNTLELLMMGILVPETCWTSNKICNKNLCCI